MNKHEIDRIAAAVNALRPDWPIASLKTLMGQPELTHRPRLDVALALVWIACDSDTKTPGRVKESGPWWTAANRSGTDGDRAPKPPKPSECCRLCGRHADRCICEDGPTTRPPERTPPTDEYRAARSKRD